MALTYQDVRQALAASGARWRIKPRLRGTVLQHPLGRRVDEMTEAEDQKLRTRPDPDLTSVIASARSLRAFKPHAAASVRDADDALPSRLDWRNYRGLNAITAVRHQMECGSCVAFSTIALLESMLLIEHGLRANLSEAEFFFCSQWASCGTGWWEGFAIGRALHEGAVVDSVLPYNPAAPSCPVVAHREDIIIRATNDVAYLHPANRKGYLAEVGPMIACFSVYEDFDAFWRGGSGIYSHVIGAYEGGHCVLVVGYDDDEGCWICKNSWGVGGGETGFFRIAYGECDLDTFAFRGVRGIRLGGRWKLRMWTDRFAGTNATDLMVHNPITRGWSLGTLRNGALSFATVGDTTGFGDVADGRPFWTGSFLGGSNRQLLFYYPNDRNWWIGNMQGTQLQWTNAGNTNGFGQVWDGRPFWTGYFSMLDRRQILFHYPGDSNWWCGTFRNGQLDWSLVGNTAGFGNLADGRPFWIGDFNADALDEVLFYYPGDHTWWLGSLASGQLTWTSVGNTAGFGNLADGRPFWTGYLRGVFRTDILFHYPNDHTWWLGTLRGSRLEWTLIGNTTGFGQLWDGRPIWVDDFNGAGGFDILFYYPGDANWWLGSLRGDQLQWSLVGNTSGFGQVWDGRPFYKGRFTGSYPAELLFHFPPDGSWWLGQIRGGQLGWTLVADTTGTFVFE